MGGGGGPSRPRRLSPRPAPAAPALDSAAPGDLTDALCEFDAVLADFASPFRQRRFRYEEHLERMKRRSSASVSDGSGLSDSESKCAPPQGRGPLGTPGTRAPGSGGVGDAVRGAACGVGGLAS